MSDDQSQGSSSVVDLFFDWYHVPALVLVVAAMLAIRLQAYDSFVRDGAVYFSGNDAWYHLRQVEYTVRHWPFTMPYDPWTYFPYGTNAAQFGTLYDQLVATAALVVGLGSPSSDLVAKTLLVAPAVSAQDAGQGNVNISLAPADGEVEQGAVQTYEVIVEDADNGIGAYEFNVSVGDSGVGEVSDYALTASDTDFDRSEISADNSTLTLEAALGNDRAARTYWQRALDRTPDRSSLREKLAAPANS